MPAKAPVDENVKFLFACLLRSDYKSIDFVRVAADFSINPAAARMRWSRLKKTINPDEISSPTPPKVKWPPRRLELEDLKETKQIARVIQKEKRTERKAKVRAEQKIGIVVKGEKMPYEDDDDDVNEEVASGDVHAAGDMKYEQLIDEYSDTKPPVLKTEGKDTVGSRPDRPQTSKEDIPNYLGSPHPTLGIFHPTSALSRIPTPRLSKVQAPGLDEETDTEAWDTTILAKHEPSTVGSPYSSSSSFSPASSTRTTASPPAQTQRAPQKWRPDNLLGCKTRNSSRRISGDGNRVDGL